MSLYSYAAENVAIENYFIDMLCSFGSPANFSFEIIITKLMITKVNQKPDTVPC